MPGLKAWGERVPAEKYSVPLGQLGPHDPISLYKLLPHVLFHPLSYQKPHFLPLLSSRKNPRLMPSLSGLSPCLGCQTRLSSLPPPTSHLTRMAQTGSPRPSSELLEIHPLISAHPQLTTRVHACLPASWIFVEVVAISA